jgi:hypothetical protein
MRWVLWGAVLLGCDARYSDLRPDEARVDAGLDASPATTDASLDTDAGVALDAAPALDAGLSEDGSAAVVIASGPWEGRGGYDAAGQVTLEHLGGDRYALVTSVDFASAAVPSPVLLVSDRDALGSRLLPTDQRVATLDASQLRGVHRFELTLPRVPTYAWIYCEPFGVETARARLELR